MDEQSHVTLSIKGNRTQIYNFLTEFYEIGNEPHQSKRYHTDSKDIKEIAYTKVKLKKKAEQKKSDIEKLVEESTQNLDRLEEKVKIQEEMEDSYGVSNLAKKIYLSLFNKTPDPLINTVHCDLGGGLEETTINLKYLSLADSKFLLVVNVSNNKFNRNGLKRLKLLEKKYEKEISEQNKAYK